MFYRRGIFSHPPSVSLHDISLLITINLHETSGTFKHVPPFEISLPRVLQFDIPKSSWWAHRWFTSWNSFSLTKDEVQFFICYPYYYFDSSPLSPSSTFLKIQQRSFYPSLWRICQIVFIFRNEVSCCWRRKCRCNCFGRRKILRILQNKFLPWGKFITFKINFSWRRRQQTGLSSLP